MAYSYSETTESHPLASIITKLLSLTSLTSQVSLTSLVFLLPLPINIHAQQPTPWETWLEEQATAGDDGTAFADDIHDILSHYAENPLNINTATREQLEQLPFLTDRQIEDICQYVYYYGPVKTMGELTMIESLDSQQRRLLQCFLYAGDEEKKGFPSLSDLLKHGRSDLIATAKVPFYDRRGDRNGYLGYKYKHWFRYEFTCGDRLRIGLTGAQDAGEPFFSGGNGMGYDYYSLYLLARKIGRIETIALGRYRLSFGMGLVVNTSLGFGKTATLGSLGRNTNAIRAHSSRSEAGYFQGAAATVSITDGLTATAFVSYRPFDATLNKDDGTAATLITSGYHRTQTEMGKKNNTHATAAGANIRYAAGGFHVGATAVYTHLDRDLRPNTTTLYRRHYATGNDFLNAGIDYGYRNHRLAFNGETAIDRNGAPATINSLNICVAEGLSLTLLQRFYSYRYTSLYAGSFNDGGRVQNESGVYLGAEWNPTSGLHLSAYTDLARFAWPKYRISGSSISSDNQLAATLDHRRWTFAARYRLRIRQRDNADKTALATLTEQRARLTATYTSPAGWSSTTRAHLTAVGFENQSTGWMAAEDIAYSRHKWLRLNATIAYFDTDNYDSRVYAYERGPLYTLSSPSFYGNGIRYTLMTRAEIPGNITLTAKLGVTNYFDRHTISSSYQAIEGSSATDLEVQMRWKF